MNEKEKEDSQDGKRFISPDAGSKGFRPIDIIGIGASAGGLEALQEFLTHLPAGIANIAIIIAQHLSPSHKSMLVQLLSRGTKLQVKEAKNGASLEADVVYITPPDTEISISKSRLSLRKPKNAAGPKPSVDIFFQSLAEHFGNRVIGIILSGTGSDGAYGIRAVKLSGGITIVQDPRTAKYDGMPQSAIDTTQVDYVLPPESMGALIKNLLEKAPTDRSTKLSSPTPGKGIDETSLEKVFKLLSKRTGTDFSNYKPSTIGRRLEKRLAILRINSVEEYLKYIEKDPKELDMLFDICLIGVTSFFRDKESFKALERELKKLLDSKATNEPVRAWVAGCATGEEAYTIAIIVSELLKAAGKQLPVQIFATDVDEKAVSFARSGIYSRKATELVPDKLLKEYFVENENSYEVAKSIRSMVLFTKHDLTNNPPFLKLDLVSCRNLLIYFSAGLQQQILPLFHYSLHPNGILFLGKSENIGSFADLFASIDEKNKLFHRKRGGHLRPVRFSTFTPQKIISAGPAKKDKNELTIPDLVKETLFNTFEHPYVVINDSYDVLEVQGDVRLYLTLQQGLMNANIVKMANGELQTELRATIGKVIKNKEPFKSSIRKFKLFGQTHLVRFIVKPLLYTEVNNDLYVVIFEAFDASELRGQYSEQPDNDAGTSRISELEQELNATREHLQTYIEELETTNEELQSLNEEMQSTNEELQSSTEELETSNEELQSTNEEVQIAYTELKSTHEELERKEALLKEKDAGQMALLNNSLQSIVLVDFAYKIIAFNEKAKATLQSLFNKSIAHGGSIIDTLETDYLPVFIDDFKKALEGPVVTGERIIWDVQKKPRWFMFNYTPVLESGGPVRVVSVSMLDITETKVAQTELQKTEKLLASVFNATNVGVCVTDETGRFVDLNQEYCKIYGYTHNELIGQSFTLIVPVEDRKKAQKLHDRFIKTGKEVPSEWQVQRKDGSLLDVFVSAELLTQPDGTRLKVTSVRDITETKRYKNLLTETQASAHVGGWEFDPALEYLVLTDESYKLLEVEAEAKVYLKNVTDHLVEPDAESLNLAFKRAWNNGNPFEMEMRLTTSRGNTKWLRITCKPLRANRKTIKLFGTFQDISKRKNYELALLHSENKYRSIIENSVNAFFLTMPDGSIIDANKAAEEMFGYSMKELPKIGRFGILDHEDPRLDKLLAERTKKGSARGELTGIRKNGERFPCEVSSVVFQDTNGESRTSMVIEDISERKKAEREIALLMHNTEENFVLLDKQLNIVSFNDQFRKQYAKYFDREVKKGENIIDYAQPERRKAAKAIYDKVLAGSEEESELQIPEADNSTTYFTLRYKPAYDEKQEVIGAFVTISDVTSRKLAELELLASEKRYRALVENGGDAVAILTPDGAVSYVSASIKNVLGYTESEALQLNLFAALHPDDAEGAGNALKKSLESPGEIVKGHTARLMHKDGNWRWCEAYLINMLHDPTINGIIDNFRDVTEKINAEQKLKEAQSLLEKAQEVGNIGHWVSDPGIEKGSISWSRQTYRIFGSSESQFDGTTQGFFKLVHPEDLESVKQAAKDAFANVRPYNLDHRILLPDKTVRWVHQQAEVTFDESGAPQLMVGVVQDITEQKEAELALQQSEEKYRVIFESSPLPKWIYEEKTQRFLEVNQSAIQQYGFSAEEFMQMTIDQLKLPEELEQIRKHVATFRGQEGVLRFGQWTHRKKNGELITVETIGHRLIYNDKKAMMILARDVTDEARHQLEIQQSNERFVYASKATSDAIWDWDVEANKIFWGDGYRTLFGYPLKNHYVEESLWATKIHPDDFDRIWQTIVEARKNKDQHTWSGEYRFQRADGSYAHVKEKAIILRSEKGKPIRMIGALQDITEAKIAEERLIEERNMLRAIIDNIPDHIFVKNRKLEQVVSNKALYTEVFNLKSEAEMLGKTMLDFFEPGIAKMYEKDDRLVIKTGKSVIDKQEFTVDRQGKKMFLSTTKVPLKNYKGEIIGLVGIARNITEKYHKDLEFQRFTERLNNILESISDPFFALNKDWQYIYMNSAAEQQMGYGKGELIGKDVRKVFPTIKDSLVGQKMAEVFKEQKPVTFELYYEPFDIWYEETIYPTSEGISVYFRNVNDRKNAEEQLQDAYTEKSNILESIRDGFYTVNRSWQITYWNKEAENLLNKTREEVLGVNVWEVFPDIADRKFYAAYHQVMKNREPASFEDHFENTNTWYELNVYPSEDGISVYFKDVTAKKQADEEIRIAKERYDMVAKVSKDAIYDRDIVNDSITWGEGFETLFGHSWGGGQSSVEWFSAYVHPDDDPNDSLRLQKVLKNTKETTWTSEYRFRKADGTYADILERGFIIRDRKGKALRMIGSMADITERKQHELTLKELNLQLTERASQLAASNTELERFAYVASHDLQEPLRMISSFLQLLERKYESQLDEKAFEYIRYAVDGADRMKRLILDLLEYSRANASNQGEPFQNVNMQEVAATVKNTFNSELEKLGATLTIDPLPIVLGYRAQLSRLLQNLVGNALKYHQRDVPPVVEVGCNENETEWVISVKDNGIGIDPKYFDKIFIIFQRLHNRSEFSGTGIGLAICKKIAEKHGGQIWVESKIGEGSTFFVSLPKTLLS